MPRLDGTGPAGKGKMTGRGMGKCEEASSNRQGDRFGVGACGRRRGMGRGRFCDFPISQEDQK
ncbi:MAG: DUF5320 domain-containing protein [Patescibacteria group bacterium]|nr:DUF5320 domain-containing protein [Patescibacteria group bacterium]